MTIFFAKYNFFGIHIPTISFKNRNRILFLGCGFLLLSGFLAIFAIYATYNKNSHNFFPFFLTTN